MIERDGKKYYSIKEILEILEKECGKKYSRLNTFQQFLYRNKFFHIKEYRDDSAKGQACSFYAEETANIIIEYFYNKNKIREHQAEIRKLSKKNRELLKK